ncbi:hypothetical protein PIB30_029903 [Stylosanthes scabra]|uniref:F-box domain-containing protein n=1 Tax=Stylosanthes scabra TaxID=79078 RepID=A0ABU6RBR3_9FABA|nr:hypothetical protein [Stylosanthes scabra]
MDGLLLSGNHLRCLPEELVIEIFLHLDAPSILACRATCRYWRQKLSSYEFLLEVTKRWLARGSHIIIHFGYSLTEHLSVDWIMKIDPVTGELFPFQFPFGITQRGWFDVIGVENGLFCLRFCQDGRESLIMVWNPATGQHRYMQDPLHHRCPDCPYHYALAFFPASTEYAVLYISKEHDDNAPPVLSMYTSFQRNWDFQLPCPAKKDKNRLLSREPRPGAMSSHPGA